MIRMWERRSRIHQPLNNRTFGCERRSEAAGLFVAISRGHDGTVVLLPNERHRVPVGHADGIANPRRRVTHIDIPVAARHSIENGTFDRSTPLRSCGAGGTRGWHPGGAHHCRLGATRRAGHHSVTRDLGRSRTVGGPRRGHSCPGAVRRGHRSGSRAGVTAEAVEELPMRAGRPDGATDRSTQLAGGDRRPQPGRALHPGRAR